MNLEPNDLVLFARVVDEGSFSRAADRLGYPKSTVSRRVAALETQLGEQLLTLKADSHRKGSSADRLEIEAPWSWSTLSAKPIAVCVQPSVVR